MTAVTVVSVGDTATAVIAALAQQPGTVHLVRRCPELAELLAACQSGLAQVAVVAEFVEELTATLVDRLAAVGVSVVAVASSPEEAQRLRGLGAVVVTEQVTPERLGQVVRAAVEGRRRPGSAGFAVPVVQPPDPGYDAGTLAPGANTDGANTDGANTDDADGADGPQPPLGRDVPVAAAAGDGGEVRGTFAIRTGTGEPAPGKPDLVEPGLTNLETDKEVTGRDTKTGQSQRGQRRPAPEKLLKVASLGARLAHVLRPMRSASSSNPPATHAGASSAGTSSAGAGTLVAVWGPIGSPGRTTLAINLAAEQAAAGRRVMLVDADSYGASVAASLGLLDESASFAQACRAADQGALSLDRLAKTATQVVFDGGTFSLLTGLTRADRWPELRAAAVERVLDLARELVELVIVDCGFSLENDEELSYDTVAPRRNAATLTVLSQADLIYAIGSGDPLGIPRLIRGLDELGQACPGAEVRVVVNKVRRKAVGRRPEKSLVQAWERFGPVGEISHFLPWEPELTDTALLEGRLLRELAADAALSRAIRDISCAADQRNQ